VLLVGALVGKVMAGIVRGALGSMGMGNPELFANVARFAVIAFAVIAALDILEIAPTVVSALWIAFLALIVGSVALAFGLGGREAASQLMLGRMLRAEDFVNRYQQGHPSEGYSEEEVMQRYQNVASNIPEDVYQQSAEESFARLSPQERKEFFQFLRQRAQQQVAQGFTDFNQEGGDDRYQDPHELAQLTTRMRQQQPGLLEKLLGGDGGGQGMLSNPLVKSALAGITAMAMRKIM
jgi:hypothetical protein